MQMVGDSLENKGIKINVKKAYFSKFKVTKGKEMEVMDDEKRVIEAAMSLQVAMLHKVYGKGQVYPLKNLTSNFQPGMACNGIYISDMDMSFGPGLMFLSAFFKEIETSESAFC